MCMSASMAILDTVTNQLTGVVYSNVIKYLNMSGI